MNNSYKVYNPFFLDYDLIKQKPFVFKDFDFSKIELNEIRHLIFHLEKLMLVKKKYLTIDLKIQHFKENSLTCKNPNWHLDGINNNYLIYSFGSNLTSFLTNKIELDINSTNLPSINSLLNQEIKKIDKLETFNASDFQPVTYTSNDVHKGNVCKNAGNRFFLRLCYSDYITPKNKILKSY